MPHNILICKSLIFACLILKIYGFNLALDEKTARYMVSPVVEQLGSGTPPQLPNTAKSSFYGYDFNLFTKKDGTISMTIGSPKMTDPALPGLQDTSAKVNQEVKGSILSCDVKPTFVKRVPPKCRPAHPANPQVGDGFGMFVPTTPTGDAQACSTTRAQDCGDLRYSPGYCYKSTNFGSTWQQNKETKSLSCPTTDVEVLFVLDGSSSVGKDNFVTVKQWVNDITRKLNIEKGGVTVGVVQYSHYSDRYPITSQPWIVTHIKIGEYKTYAAFSSAVDKITLQGFTTFTGKALEKVAVDFKNTPNYNKPTTKQVMVLLTDGKASDKDDVPGNAEKLRDIGVIPYAVGVGGAKKVNRTELRLIANGDAADDNRVFMAQNFAGLDAIAKELQAEIGGLVLEGSSGGAGTAGYKMQFAAVGLAGAYSKLKPVKKRLRRSTAINPMKCHGRHTRLENKYS
uniref:integrin alpha-D-like n=1 Tax=Styela clava TaxID=7725 RepID=UPI001939594A|nr:integrin alpha-D-like [Styela clava]